jgi:thiamine transport system substrate-binding protein
VKRSRTILARLVPAVVAIIAVTASCSSDDTATGTDGAVAPEEGAEVVLVTYDSFALPQAAAEAFTARTGATIRVVASGDAGAAVTKALLSAGAPEGDVLFGVDSSLAGRVLAADLLEPFTPAGVDQVPEAVRLPGELGELLTPVDTGEVCVLADSEWFASRSIPLPTDLGSLTDPLYRDLLVVQSPVTSSPGLAFLVGTVARSGEEWPRYWAELRDNGVRVRPSWDDSYNTDYTVSGGDRPLVVSYASSPPAEVVFSEGAIEAPSSVVIEDTCVRQVEYAGVLRGAANPELARQLVEFMVSPEWQAELPLTNFVFPVLTGTPLPPVFERFAVRPAEPLDVPADRVAAERDAWIEQWRTILE